jgi:hypothetical protein
MRRARAPQLRVSVLVVHHRKDGESCRLQAVVSFSPPADDTTHASPSVWLATRTWRRPFATGCPRAFARQQAMRDAYRRRLSVPERNGNGARRSLCARRKLHLRQLPPDVWRVGTARALSRRLPPPGWRATHAPIAKGSLISRPAGGVAWRVCMPHAAAIGRTPAASATTTAAADRGLNHAAHPFPHTATSPWSCIIPAELLLHPDEDSRYECGPGRHDRSHFPAR